MNPAWGASLNRDTRAEIPEHLLRRWRQGLQSLAGAIRAVCTDLFRRSQSPSEKRFGGSGRIAYSPGHEKELLSHQLVGCPVAEDRPLGLGTQTGRPACSTARRSKRANQVGPAATTRKKVTGRKRHAVVDTLGLLQALVTRPVDVQDRDGAKLALQAFRRAVKFPKIIWAERPYRTRVDWEWVQ